MTITLPDHLGERFVAALERLAVPPLPAESPIPQPQPGGLLTKPQVAARLGKSPREVERLVKRGKLRKVPDLGRAARFRPADVDKLVATPEAREVGRRRL